MNKTGQYLSDFCGKENVAVYEEGQIDQMEMLKVQQIWELLLEARNTTNSEGLSAGHLVDVGCGYGHLTKNLAKHFERTTGVDISEEQIMRAKDACSDPSIEFIVGKAEILPLENNSADAITAIFSVHIMDANAFTSECLRVLKPGGVAIFWGDTWGSVVSVDGSTTTQPDATYLVDKMNQEFLEINRRHSHPNFYILDCHKTLFNEITVTDKKSLLSGRIEVIISVAEMKKYVYSIPFYRGLAERNPIDTFSQKLKLLWKMEDAQDEDVIVRATGKTFPILIRK